MHHIRINKGILAGFLCITLFACTPSHEATSTPTIDPTPARTTTPIPIEIKGTIFWDANGSGLQDKTSFIVPDYDPQSPPYFFELLAANQTSLGILSPGVLATVHEPPIPGIQVCQGDLCTITDSEGFFILRPKKVFKTYLLEINDPNQGDPEKEFRYINQWNGPIVIERSQTDGLTLPEQHLNDTEIVKIAKVISASTRSENLIGLMQGFLTYPFLKEHYPQTFIWNYFDILSNQYFDDRGENTFLSSRDDIMVSYDGKYKFPADWMKVSQGEKFSGVSDSHPGLDFSLPAGTSIVSGLPNSEVFTFPVIFEQEIRVNLRFIDPVNLQEFFTTSAAQLSQKFVEEQDIIYRGQLVGASGMDGLIALDEPAIPQVHFELSKRITKGWMMLDPFRTTVSVEPKTSNYWGSEYSYWTVDNIPQFPLVKLVD